MGNTKWRFIGSNMPEKKTKEEQDRYNKQQFKWGLRLSHMQPNKAKIDYKARDKAQAEDKAEKAKEKI